MSHQVTISTKAIGRRKRILDDWSLTLPPNLEDDGGGLTLRELITQVVIEQVRLFQERQEENRFLHVLSKKQIEASAQSGKVEMGGRDFHQKVDVEDAAAVALQGFEDGLYLVSIDGNQEKELDAQVYLQSDSRVTFIRLVMLAGA